MSNVQSHNLKPQSVWNSPGGRYDDISRSIADAIEHAVERLPAEGRREDPRSRHRHRLGLARARARFPAVKVTGADIAEQMLEYARTTAAKEQLVIDYQHADAEHLPFAEGAFDAAVSTSGVMFVGKPRSGRGRASARREEGWTPDACHLEARQQPVPYVSAS